MVERQAYNLCLRRFDSFPRLFVSSHRRFEFHACGFPCVRRGRLVVSHAFYMEVILLENVLREFELREMELACLSAIREVQNRLWRVRRELAALSRSRAVDSPAAEEVTFWFAAADAALDVEIPNEVWEQPIYLEC